MMGHHEPHICLQHELCGQFPHGFCCLLESDAPSKHCIKRNLDPPICKQSVAQRSQILSETGALWKFFH